MTEKTIAQLEQESLDQVVGPNGETRRVFMAAFNRVVNTKNWKYPIDTKLPVATVTADDLETIKLAVEFFTGGAADVVRCGAEYQITAPGYYVSVGA